MSVVLQETLEILVWSTTLKHDLNVVLMLSKIWRVLLHGNHCAGLDERILGIVLGGTESDTLIHEKALGEVISIDNSEHSAVDIQVHANVKITPCVGLGLMVWDENLVSLEENTLGDAAVLNSIFEDVQCIVIEVVVHGAFAHAVVLVGVLNYWLLEVGIEVQDLKIDTMNYCY